MGNKPIDIIQIIARASLAKTKSIPNLNFALIAQSGVDKSMAVLQLTYK